MLIECGLLSPFVPVPVSAVHAAICVCQAAEDGEPSCSMCVCENEWVMIAGQRSFPSVMSVLSEELFCFCLQNEIGFVN